MAFSKQHYEAIAVVLAGAAEVPAAQQREFVARVLAELFARDNPRFDATRFLAASKVAQ
jgi:hypothetical protein